MAQLQLTLNPLSGSETENFCEFEHFLRRILAVAALPTKQLAIFYNCFFKMLLCDFFELCLSQHVKIWNFQKQLFKIGFLFPN